MADKFVSEQNLKFLFYDVFDGEALLELPLFAEHSREMFDMILQTALKLGKGLLRSCLVEMDRVPPRLENGAVIDDVSIAVQRWGELSPNRDNVVVVLHALTGDSHITGPAGPGHNRSRPSSPLSSPSTPRAPKCPRPA